MAQELQGHWDTLISAATLGTSRASAVEGIWPSGVKPMPAQSPEKTLLRAAFTTYLWELAGSRAAPGTLPQGAIAPSPGQALVSEAAAWRLARMLSGTHRELVPEWFALAAEAQRVLPAHWLPTALDALSPEERNRFAPVLGPQALWLAQMNPHWTVRASDAEPSEERWAHGTLKERGEELKALRKQDPDRARAWLEQTWSTEPPEGRAELARVLQTGLTARDQGFLERLLDDRRKEVRAVGVESLIRLSESDHAHRNWRRVEPLIAAKPGAAGKRSHTLQLHIQTPEQLDKSALRDGIEAKRPAHLKIGERAYWLWQMVARVRPRLWTERFECDVPSFLDAVSATEYGGELLSAFAAAAERHPDINWTRALCQRYVVAGIRSTATANLIAALGPEHQAPMLEELLSTDGAGDFEQLHAVLNSREIAWSERSTALMMVRVRDAVERSPWSPHALLAGWALRANVPAASAALAKLRGQVSGDKASWQNAVDQMALIIDFRAAMRKELLGE
jgi:hypothetical protein